MATYIRVDRTGELVARAQQQMAENRFLQQERRELQAAQQQIIQRQALAVAGAFLQGGRRRLGLPEEPTSLIRRKDFYLLLFFDLVTSAIGKYAQADVSYNQSPLISKRDDFNPAGRQALMHLAITTAQKKVVDAAIEQAFEAMFPGNTGIWQQFVSGGVPYTKNVISKPAIGSSVPLTVAGTSNDSRMQGVYASYGQVGKWGDWQLVAGDFAPSFQQTIQIIWSKPTP